MEKIFNIEEHTTRSKVLSLREAVSRCVKPGMKLHVNIGADANAGLREILRQHIGKDPGFSLISAGVTTPDLISLIASGLVREVITSNCSYTYPAPRPIPLVQKMHEEGRLRIESWSLYALEQRLMAAALGIGFMPTRSLVGSSLAEENRDSFAMIGDPFDREASIGAVRSLSPDLSIIHGCVADQEGNTLLSPPYFASLWGAKASRGGVIVTVERIVPTAFIRKHSALVRLPGYLVTYVCPVKLGAHPQGLSAESIGEEGYGEDYAFILGFVKASQNEDRLKEWIREWVLHCPSQEEYLDKLGSERIRSLKGKPPGDEKGDDAAGPAIEGTPASAFTSTEMMIVAAAREIKRIVLHKGYQTLLSGIGSPGLAAWLAFYLLKKEEEPVDLVTGAGQFGFEPRPGDPFLINLANVMTCKMLTDTVEVYGTLVGGANNRCLSVLGTAQIDPYGNLNTVMIGNRYFIGVGGANDAVQSRETLAIAKQSRDRFVEKVDYVGCPGQKVKTLVTDLGIFQKHEGEEKFSLTRYFRPSTPSGKEDRLHEIQERCGWELHVGGVLEEVTPPDPEELSILRALDPQKIFLGKS